jgi:hypothetical protein
MDALPLSQRYNYCIFHVVKTPTKKRRSTKVVPPKGPIPDWSLYLDYLLKMRRALLGLCRLDMTLELDAPKALPACRAVSELSRDPSLTKLSYHASTPCRPTTLLLYSSHMRVLQALNERYQSQLRDSHLSDYQPNLALQQI